MSAAHTSHIVLGQATTCHAIPRAITTTLQLGGGGDTPTRYSVAKPLDYNSPPPAQRSEQPDCGSSTNSFGANPLTYTPSSSMASSTTTVIPRLGLGGSGSQAPCVLRSSNSSIFARQVLAPLSTHSNNVPLPQPLPPTTPLCTGGWGGVGGSSTSNGATPISFSNYPNAGASAVPTASTLGVTTFGTTSNMGYRSFPSSCGGGGGAPVFYPATRAPSVYLASDPSSPLMHNATFSSMAQAHAAGGASMSAFGEHSNSVPYNPALDESYQVNKASSASPLQQPLTQPYEDDDTCGGNSNSNAMGCTGQEDEDDDEARPNLGCTIPLGSVSAFLNSCSVDERGGNNGFGQQFTTASVAHHDATASDHDLSASSVADGMPLSQLASSNAAAASDAFGRHREERMMMLRRGPPTVNAHTTTYETPFGHDEESKTTPRPGFGGDGVGRSGAWGISSAAHGSYNFSYPTSHGYYHGRRRGSNGYHPCRHAPDSPAPPASASVRPGQYVTPCATVNEGTFEPSAVCMQTPQTSRAKVDESHQLDCELNAINTATRGAAPPPVTRITDNVFIGGFPVAETFAELRALGVRHMVNCCSGQQQLTPEEGKGFSIHNIAAKDDPSYFIFCRHLQEFCDHVAAVVASGEKVFVHCIGGVNRSASLVVGYMMDRLGFTPVEAVKCFRDNGRNFILTNKTFRTEIIDHFLLLCDKKKEKEEREGQ